jgi:Ca-activated chloride channel family protein
MRKRILAGLGGGLTASLIFGAVTGACTVSSESGSGFYGTGDNGPGPGGVGSTGTGNPTGGGGSGGSSGFPGSTGSGEFPSPPPPPPPPPPQDAGPDAPFTCEGLDKSQPLVLYLSADDSNSMGSPTYARELLSLGVAPPKQMIRTYEFLNYYRIAYPAPPVGKLSILPQMEETGVAGELDLQIGVGSFDAVKPRRAITVTFVLDTSGSMSGPGIERERAAARAIMKSLVAGDIVNMVTWNTSNNTILDGHVVSGPSDPTVAGAIDAIEASGGTDLHSGLVSGYKLAQQNYGEQRLNRVVLISDGGANVGETDEEVIAMNSLDADKEGIYLVGIGTGPALGYNDLLMDVVTDKGRGAYIYLDSPQEAEHMFVERFDETMEVAARGVQVEVTLPWYFKIEKFYGEEYSEDPAEVEPQHLAPSDAMVFSQVLKACDPAEVNPDHTITVKAKWETPLTYLPQETEVTSTVGALLAAMNKAQLTKGKAIVAFAEALKDPTVDALKAAHSTVTAANPGGTDKELNEIKGLIEMHPNYK